MSRYEGSTALVVVDMQNDFADPAGSLYVAGGESIVEYVDDQIVAARRDGALAAYTQDWHPAHTPHFAQDGGIWPVHCVVDSWGAALHPDLLVAGPVVRKGTNGEDGYSGFTMRDPISGQAVPTELEGLLRGRGIRRVLVCGLATDYCVVATALDAVALGFETDVLLAGIRAVDLQPEDGPQAIERMRLAGVRLIEEAPSARADASGPGR